MSALVRTVDPAVFTPRPRVGSALLRLDRVGPGAPDGLRELVRGAFAHRRKSLARSLELVSPGRLEAARSALEELGLPADARAQSLSPAQFTLAVGGAAMRLLMAPAKLNLCLYVGPTREDGLHEIASIFEPLELADKLTVSHARTRSGGHGDGVRGTAPTR